MVLQFDLKLCCISWHLIFVCYKNEDLYKNLHVKYVATFFSSGCFQIASPHVAFQRLFCFIKGANEILSYALLLGGNYFDHYGFIKVWIF